MPQRYFIVGITAVAALWLYIDRVCFSTLADPAQVDLGITDEQKDFMLGAFFFTYGLFQIPMGSLADRFGTRLVLAVSITAWSLVTAATGFVNGFIALLGVRLLLGITESAAYPAAAGLVKNWARPTERGRFSSFVALGGRLGGATAPKLTAWLAIALAGLTLITTTGTNPSGVNWRGVFLIYGLCGLIVAGLFWILVRDHPPLEANTVRSRPAPMGPRQFLRQLGVLARDRNMWLSGSAQFGVNVGWAFVVTLLPSYLNKVHNVPLEKRGDMQSLVLYTGCSGMILGGFVTDALRKRLGPRMGRSIPIGTTLIGCAAAMFLIPQFSTPWPVIAALGVMAFLVDFHNPSIWSFAQDVGGRRVGAALGWGNMWGNFGASVSPYILGAFSRRFGWDATFTLCGFVFALAAVCGFLLDATKPVEPEPPVTA
ncbi:MAG TPA: MFS transporter [Urbifossiella sp.]|nr:MFS transporter [Urbifossiella sp.]